MLIAATASEAKGAVMKTSRGVRLGLLLGVVALVLGCTPTQQYSVQGAERAAGADAHIEIERQETGNWLVTVEVENLLPPARMAEGLTTYSVWFQASGDQARRAGNLAYDADDRAGQMTATTSRQNFQIILTGEADPDAGSPSDHVVFRQNVEAP